MSAVPGVWSAALTPIDADLQPNAEKAVPYYRELLDRGCDGINVLGTTGEAMSFSADQRVRYMEALASSGLPMERMMAGTGAASLGDAARLTRAAIEFGFAAVLVMPPFFFREVSDDGIAVFFAALFDRVDPPARSVLLYNFPRMTGFALHADLIDRLAAQSNDRIFGMKDSSNDPQLQTDVTARNPGFAVFPGSESDLPAAKKRGVAGCISGSVALWPELARAVFESGDEAQARELTRRRAALGGVPLVAAMRYLTASLRGDPDWGRAMPPQQTLSPSERRRIDRAISP
jgi:4-hydroxy-tetrahydrodipicolinate synthase